MSLLINCHEISKAYSHKELFSSLSFSVHEGERLGIIGANGVGKSTLLNILSGKVEPDDGQVSRRKNLRIAFVEQSTEFNGKASALQELTAYAEQLSLAQPSLAAETVLTKAGFVDAEVLIETLSGGWRKRLAIVKELMADPDLVFFDEPTNHLDITSVLWLENLLMQASFAWVVISHDRFFLDRTVTRIAEIHPSFPNAILTHECGYSAFGEVRDEYFANLARQEAALSNKARRETEWLRRGPKARTTKSRSRIDAANSLIGELGDLRHRLRKSESQIEFAASGRKSKQLIVAKEITKRYDGKTLFADLSLVLSPQLVVGILGPNGCGKSTLIQALQKKLAVDQGEVEHAPSLQIAYFEQNRSSLNPEETLRHALCPDGSDSVLYRDQPVHIASWAQRFQFDPDQLTQRVGQLSGGEQARILIARLMLVQADVLVLDEPTNDLDINTLEILEDSLTGFPGCVILVSHDRFMMSRLADLSVGFLGDGETEIYASYEQWERDFAKGRPERLKSKKTKTASDDKAETKSGGVRKGRLSFKDKHEYEQMETKILAAEAQLEQKQAEVEGFSGEAIDPEAMQSAYEDLQVAQETVEKLYARWSELESKIKPDS